MNLFLYFLFSLFFFFFMFFLPIFFLSIFFLPIFFYQPNKGLKTCKYWHWHFVIVQIDPSFTFSDHSTFILSLSFSLFFFKLFFLPLPSTWKEPRPKSGGSKAKVWVVYSFLNSSVTSNNSFLFLFFSFWFLSCL